jgi:hypothetical protein
MTSDFDEGTQITLQARPINGSGVLFRGWTGVSCSDAPTFHDCTFVATAPDSVGVTLATQTVNTIFISSSNVPANLGGARTYDQVCNDLATAAGINNSAGTAFAAWVSDSASNAATLIANANGFARMDGAPFANSPADITLANRIWYPIVFDETGRPIARGYFPLTGTNPDGTAALGFTCNDWTTTASSARAVFGDALGGPVSWSSGWSSECSGSAPIVCIEKDRSGFGIAPGVSAGKLIFVSKDAYTPGTGSPDAFCTNAGPDPATRNFKALLATTTAAATVNANLVASTSYVTKDGVFLGTGSQIMSTHTFVTGPWEYPDGTFPNNAVRMWGGAPSIVDYAASGADDCSDWTSPIGSGRDGFVTTLEYFFDASGNTIDCSANLGHLLCVEQ